MNKTDKSANHQICTSTLSLLKEGDWDRLTLEQIANHCDMPLDTLHRNIPTKEDILSVLVEWINTQVSDKALAFEQNVPVQDRLFDVLMLRFEIMQPHKEGLCAVARACRRSPELAHRMYKAQINAMRDMLELATPRHNGIAAHIQEHLLLGIYHYAFLQWESDSSKDLDKTMATINNTLLKLKSDKLFA